MRVVIGITTLPSRLSRNLLKTLESLKSQTVRADKIYLNVPEFCSRENCVYDLDSVNGKLEGVTVLSGIPDDGPITKLLPILDHEKDPETFIALFDDDTCYHRDTLKNLLKHHKLKAIGHSSRNPRFTYKNDVKDLPHSYCPKVNKKVAFLETVSAVLYQRDCFPESSAVFRDWIKTLHPDARFVDDIVIGAWLHKSGIKRWMVPCCDVTWQHDHTAPSALSQGGNLSWRNKEMYDKLRKSGYYTDAPCYKDPPPWLLPLLISLSIIAGTTLIGGVAMFATYVIVTGNKNQR